MDKKVALVKLVVYVPETHADAVRQAMGEAGAGIVGNYSHNTFSIKGTGRFKPLDGAKPYSGTLGRIEEAAEERIETVCLREKVDKVVEAVRKVHPYEEMAYDIYPLL